MAESTDVGMVLWVLQFLADDGIVIKNPDLLALIERGLMAALMCSETAL